VGELPELKRWFVREFAGEVTEAIRAVERSGGG
jgi:hypothetical protein